MPAFLGLSQLQNAITARALPALEQLAANPDRLDNSLNNRFERDDPPPYESSSDSEGADALSHQVLARPEEAVLEEHRETFSKPLSDYERGVVVRTLNMINLYGPGDRFLDEVRREESLLNDFYKSRRANSHVRRKLAGRRGRQQSAVIARRNIRRRWQRLGVWNSEWGIPGRVNKQPHDDAKTWKWRWESVGDPVPSDPHHPTSRAMELRKGLPDGDYVLPPPRSRLGDDASRSEAESFIISRPWFLYVVEQLEFVERKRRIPVEQRGHRDLGEDDPITKRWKVRGDWREDWVVDGDRGRPVPGWKWRHESPSPEPEDLNLLNTDEMDFTPSEVDALEAIPPPTPPRTKPVRPRGQNKPVWGFGIPGAPGYHPPEPADPQHEGFGGDAVEHREQQCLDTGAECPVPQPHRRGRPRKQVQLPHPEDHTPAPPTPRRSARIAARNANHPPPPTAPTQIRSQPKRRVRGPPAAPRPKAIPLPSEAPRTKGRPPVAQSGGITKPALATGRMGRNTRSGTAAAAAAAAFTNLQEAKSTDQATGKRHRGRPRRN